MRHSILARSVVSLGLGILGAASSYAGDPRPGIPAGPPIAPPERPLPIPEKPAIPITPLPEKPLPNPERPALPVAPPTTREQPLPQPEKPKPPTTQERPARRRAVPAASNGPH